MAANETRSALITGAAQGLGEAIARRLHADGFRVAIADLNAEAATALAIELDASGATARAITVDVSDADSIKSAFADQVAAWGAPDILVNNAGRTVRSSVWDITPEEWDSVLSTNLRSYLVFCQLAGPAMREKGWGRIINMASIADRPDAAVRNARGGRRCRGLSCCTRQWFRHRCHARHQWRPLYALTALALTVTQLRHSRLPTGRAGGAVVFGTEARPGPSQ